MPRMLLGSLAGILIGVLTLQAQPPGIRNARVKKIDFDRMTITLTVDGKDEEFTLTEETRVLNVRGKDLKERMKDIKEGAAIQFRAQERGGKKIVEGMRLNDGKGPARERPALAGKTSVGFKPLNEMSADDKYKGEDGGLYGGGKNTPPEAHAEAARKAAAAIVPLDADGKPSKEGTIVFISLSMSNATQEFSTFKPIADRDAQKSPRVTIVDCAQGGQAMGQWAESDRPWTVAEARLKQAGVTPRQVQAAWIKLANVAPRGELTDHGKKLQKDTLKVLQLAHEHFPNLRIAYLSSRIYGGHATTGLNPEPYAYEGAFAVRWLIQDQIKGDVELNCDAARGAVKAPLLLWGPYLWADGVKGRRSDNLTWEREDLVGDGTHPSDSGRKKVAEQLLKFLKTDSTAKAWFVK